MATKELKMAKPSLSGSRMDVKSASSSVDGGMSSALHQAACQYKIHLAKAGWREEIYIMARRTSPMGMMLSFSTFLSLVKSPKASRISFSSALVMLCSFASLESRPLEAVAASAGAVLRRLAGYNTLYH